MGGYQTYLCQFAIRLGVFFTLCWKVHIDFGGRQTHVLCRTVLDLSFVRSLRPEPRPHSPPLPRGWEPGEPDHERGTELIKARKRNDASRAEGSIPERAVRIPEQTVPLPNHTVANGNCGVFALPLIGNS